MPSDDMLTFLQVLTQISLILLLFGTIVGDFALISDVSARAFKGLAAPDTPPAWLVAYDGRGTMCLFAVFAVFPLCCLKGMRQVHFHLSIPVSPVTLIKLMICDSFCWVQYKFVYTKGSCTPLQIAWLLAH